eukprot:CAMPEP_0116060218 /NCGR_PEP_ID=MMETSP0322-20121206/6277_1 /TAXON_ID=163516 /ORGANISM="Leptocylindrus danicus var. apora, Strain B651" /LENGTH=399 /DNA_ID=CAMNT_0003544781 /DNA_START=177 /DNA_END=1376 /DNA_ORIENTATION=-
MTMTMKCNFLWFLLHANRTILHVSSFTKSLNNPLPQTHKHLTFNLNPPPQFIQNTFLQASSNNDNEEGAEVDDDDDALLAAFAGLDAIGSLDEPFRDVDETKVERTGAFDKMLQNLNEVEDIVKGGGRLSKEAEEELGMYADMLGELSDKGEEGIYDKLRLDLTASGMKDLASMMDEDEEDDNDEDERIPESERQTKVASIDESNDEMIERVMKEALDEAKLRAEEAGLEGDDVLISNPDGDEEMMDEIRSLFDKAALEMKAAAAEINRDQTAINEEYLRLREEKYKEEEERIREGEEQVNKMMKKVTEEASEVEAAMKELEAAKAAVEDLSNDPLMKALNFRDAGIVKQGAFTLALLCTARALGDLVQIGGVDGNEHVFLAAVQAAIAVASGLFYFLF